MILEGIVTTINDDDTTNVAPMGPLVDASMNTLVLRPYQTSTTYQNLKRTREGVFHVTDDVELLARAAIGRLESTPTCRPAERVQGRILADACRWYAFRVRRLADRQPRTVVECEVVDRGRQRDFVGFHRARHAVLEAAILATRTQFLPTEQIRAQFEQLAVIVEKTAGDSERRAFALLEDFVDKELAPPAQENTPRHEIPS